MFHSLPTLKYDIKNSHFTVYCRLRCTEMYDGLLDQLNNSYVGIRYQ